jgi:hypothetical protein
VHGRDTVRTQSHLPVGGWHWKWNGSVCMPPDRNAQQSTERIVRSWTDLLECFADRGSNLPMSARTLRQSHRVRTPCVVVLVCSLVACSEVSTPSADAGRDARIVDAPVEADRQYTPEELNCRVRRCPTGYICVDQCANGVCGPDQYRCRPLPTECPDPPICTNTTRACDCPVCLRALCPPTCTYGNSERNVVDCNG